MLGSEYIISFGSPMVSTTSWTSSMSMTTTTSTPSVNISTNFLLNPSWDELDLSMDWDILAMFLRNLMTVFFWYLDRHLLGYLFAIFLWNLGALFVWNLDLFLMTFFLWDTFTALFWLLFWYILTSFFWYLGTFRFTISVIWGLSSLTMLHIGCWALLFISCLIGCSTFFLIGSRALLLILSFVSILTFCLIWGGALVGVGCFVLSFVCGWAFFFITSRALLFVYGVIRWEVGFLWDISAFWCRRRRASASQLENWDCMGDSEQGKQHNKLRRISNQ